MLWAVHALKEPLPTFVGGRENVVLLGDAVSLEHILWYQGNGWAI